MSIVLYSTHCPQCKVLERKLHAAGFEFTVCEDIEVMNKLGMISAPGLQINGGDVLSFKDAIAWLREVSNG